MNSAGRGITGRVRGYIMKKVITYGTFDLFHKGHYNIIKRAKALGDYLIVGVTSESFDIERGKLNVRDSLIKRIENVRRTGLADEIIIEEYQGQKVSDIIKYDIDVLVVGSDWRGKFDYLKNYCDVVYLERTKNISSTKLRSEGIIFNMGIVTDDIQDNGFVQESKYVSGVHVERGIFVISMNWTLGGMIMRSSCQMWILCISNAGRQTGKNISGKLLRKENM